MSKKIVIIVAALAIVIFGGATGYIFLAREKITTNPLSNAISETKKEGIAEKEIYKDTSGFSFEYPKNSSVSDVTPEDEEYYSVLEIEDENNPGKLTLTIKDTQSSDINEWLNGDSEMRLTEISGATTLASIPAKQLNLNRSGEKVLLTAAIENNILYLLKGPRDEGFWEEVQNLISDSFIVGERPAEYSLPSDENVIYEEEEVVE